MRSSLELLLLSFVQDGLSTPYDLKAKAGLSLGSTIPALTRLEQDGLLRSSERASRNSRSFRLTPRGLKTLEEQEWRTPPSTPDPEGLLRIAYLSWKRGSQREAERTLREASLELTGLANVCLSEAERFGSSSSPVNTNSYRWLRSRIESARLRAVGEELKKLADEIGDGARRNKSKRTRKS